MDDWLRKTRELQTEAYGTDPHSLTGREQASYITWNHTATVLELSEMLEETRWKPWATLNEGDPVIPDKAAYIKECVDALHFIANMLVAGQVTDEELWDSYRAKMEVNRERQRRAGGYQSRKGVDKCGVCGRSFDDVGQYYDKSGVATETCTKCGHAIYGEIN